MILTAIIIAKILLNDMPLKINAKSICIVIITIFLHAFVASALNGVLKTLLICVVYVIVYKSVFSITYSRAFILAFENILLMLIPDLLILFVSVYVLKIDTNIIYNVFAQTIISSTMVAIMLILLVYIFKRPLRKISNIKLTNNKEIAMYLMLALLSILAVFYTGINVSPKIENNFLGDLNTQDFKQLGILLGVYLDNAIDASKKAENKQMSIEIYPVGEDVEMIISNTYEGTINVESIGKEKYTTKGKNHGYGLMLVKRILEENKRFEAHRVLTDVVYSQKLKIKKSINK